MPERIPDEMPGAGPGEIPAFWQRGYWIKITGQAAGTNRYAWEQVNDADAPDFGTALAAGFKMSGTSAVEGWPAYEITGNTSVPIGSKVKAFPSAAGTFWVFHHGGDGGDCDSCNFLIDREALIAENKALRVRFPGGVGRCSCFPEQGLDDEDPWLAVYDADLDAWVLTRTGATCCGCFRLILNIPGDGTMTGAMAVNRSCPDAEAEPPEWNPYSYNLIFLKCCRKADDEGVFHTVAVLAGAGELNCGDDNLACENAFTVEVECVDCDLCRDAVCPDPPGLPNPTCEFCLYGCGAPVWYVDAVDDPPLFSGDMQEYNGHWFAAADSETPCLYSVGCDGATVTVEISDDSGDGVITVTFTGADGGTVEYQFTNTGLGKLDCFAEYTLARISGDAGTSPAAIDVKAYYCEACNAGCCADSVADVLDLEIDCGTPCGTQQHELVRDPDGPDGDGWYSEVFQCNGEDTYFFLFCNTDGDDFFWTLRIDCDGDQEESSPADVVVCPEFEMSGEFGSGDCQCASGAGGPFQFTIATP